MDDLNPRFTVAWIVWVVMFAVIEAASLMNKTKGDTLSEHVWALLKIDPVAVGFALLWVWLTVHFFRRKNSDSRGVPRDSTPKGGSDG